MTKRYVCMYIKKYIYIIHLYILSLLLFYILYVFLLDTFCNFYKTFVRSLSFPSFMWLLFLITLERKLINPEEKKRAKRQSLRECLKE